MLSACVCSYVCVYIFMVESCSLEQTQVFAANMPETQRLYVRAKVLGFRRSMHAQRPTSTLMKIEGLTTRKDTSVSDECVCCLLELLLALCLEMFCCVLSTHNLRTCESTHKQTSKHTSMS